MERDSQLLLQHRTPTRNHGAVGDRWEVNRQGGAGRRGAAPQFFRMRSGYHALQPLRRRDRLGVSGAIHPKRHQYDQQDEASH